MRSPVTLAALLVSLLTAPVGSWAAGKTLAVIGLNTYAPESANCPWLGCGIGHGISDRLSADGTGITVVDRAYIAEVMLAAGMKPLEEDGADGERLKAIAEVLRKHYDVPGEPGTQERPALLPRPPARIPATHLLVGSVIAEKGLGEDCTVTLRAVVIDVATGFVVPNSRIEKSVPATAEGLQKLEVGAAMAACLALDADATAVDQKVDVDRSAFYEQLAQANWLINNGRPEEALRITHLLAASVKPELLVKVAEVEAVAYRMLIDAAEQDGRQADAKALKAEAKRREQELRDQYESTLVEVVGSANGEAARLLKQAGDAFSYNDRYAEAVAQYTKALELTPDDAELWLARGSAYRALKQHDEAIADYTKAIEIQPDCAEAYCGRALVLQALGQYDKALADFIRAIEIKPDYAEAYCGRGSLHSALQQYERAIADYDRAIEIDPADAMYYFARAIAYYCLMNYEKAALDFTRAIELQPDYAEAYCSRGNVYCDLQQHDQAIADYRKAAELAPQDPVSRSNLSFTLYLASRLDEAVAAGREAVALAPDLVNAVGNLALALLASGQDDEAVTQYRRLVEIGAQAALDAGAGKDLNDLLAKQPEVHLARFCLGLLYESAGHKAEAAEQHKAYVAGAPDGKWAKDARERLARLGG